MLVVVTVEVGTMVRVSVMDTLDVSVTADADLVDVSFSVREMEDVPYCLTSREFR